MPYGDGTGPYGDSNWNCRRGRGIKGRANIVLDKEQQKKILKSELEQIESEKKEIEKKLKEIEK